MLDVVEARDYYACLGVHPVSNVVLRMKMDVEKLWILAINMIVTVEGLYNLEVRLNGYTNTGKCPGCKEIGFLEPGCCDRYNSLNSCIGIQRCDSYFTYFMRRLGSTEGGENCTMSRDGVTDHERTSMSNTDDVSLNFSNATILGLENPLKLAGVDNKWNGIQLVVEVCDKDEIGSDDLIDLLRIDISASNVTVGVESSAATYSGIHNYTTVNLSFSIQCVSNFQGPSCSECVPGFTGSQCDINIDDCNETSCGIHGECIDGINSFQCSCSLGFAGDTCTEELTTTESNFYETTSTLIGGVVGGVLVLSMTLLIIVGTTTVAFLIKRKERRPGTCNPSESDIKVSKNVVYGIERGEPVPVDLTQNSSYGHNIHQVETNPNISYIPNQQAVNMDDYEYIPHEYDYIS